MEIKICIFCDNEILETDRWITNGFAIYHEQCWIQKKENKKTQKENEKRKEGRNTFWSITTSILGFTGVLLFIIGLAGGSEVLFFLGILLFVLTALILLFWWVSNL